MPKITVPKEQVEGFKPIEGGVYEVRLDGFEPISSKDGTSINLRPKLVVINHPKHNDQRLFDNLNTGCWYIQDFVHCFGLEMVQKGDDLDIPGEFLGRDFSGQKKEKLGWTYVGPLLGRVGKVRVVVQENSQTHKEQNVIDQWYCDLTACQEKHSTNLAR